VTQEGTGKVAISTRTSADPRNVQPVLARTVQLCLGVLRGRQPLHALLQAVGIQLLIAAINILTGVITARALGPQGRGEYTAVSTWPQLLAMLAFSGLGSAIVFRMRRFPELAGRIAGAGLVLGMGHSLLAVAVGVMLLPAFMRQYDAAVVTFAQWCLISAFANSTYMLIKQCFAGIGEFRAFNLANMRPQLLYLIALVLAVATTGITARGAVIAQFATSALAVVTTLPEFVQLARPRVVECLAEARQLMRYVGRAAMMDIVFALSTYADRLVLIPMLPAGELGYYAVAYSFSRIVQLAQPAITSIVFSHMAGRSAAAGKQVHDHAIRFLAAELAAASLLLWVLGEPLLAFAYGPEFAAANGVFRLLVLEASLGALSQLTMQLFLSRDRPGTVSAIQAVVLCFSVSALLTLVPRYGASGAALGLLAAGALRLALLYTSLRTVLKLPLPRMLLTRSDFQYLLGRLR
jgi:enterobacterial common antigen flippase